MADLLDGDALRGYLADTLRTFRAMDGHMDPATSGNARVSGAILALEQVLREITSGRFTPSGDPRKPARERARKTDPETSHAAARSVVVDSELHGKITALLRDGTPRTDEEIFLTLVAQGAKCSASGVRTRRAELVDAFVVKDSGLRGTTRQGREAIRWTIN